MATTRSLPIRCILDSSLSFAPSPLRVRAHARARKAASFTTRSRPSNVSPSARKAGITFASLAISPSDQEDGAVMEWLNKVGIMMAEHVTEQKKYCCRCGSEADKTPNGGCSLRCVCAWESAHGVWVDKRGALTDEDKMYVQRTFLEAHEAEPDNELLLADYALFLWRELNEWQQAEQMLEKALALPATSARVRMRILNLYSHFLSTTPISDSKLHAHRNGSYMNSSTA